MVATPPRRSKVRYRRSHRHALHRAFGLDGEPRPPPHPVPVKHGLIDVVRRRNLPYRLLGPTSVAIQVGAPQDTRRSGRSRALTFARRTSPFGRVLVVEPDKTSADQFRRSAARYGLSHVEVACVAAWHEHTTLTMEIGPQHPATNFTVRSTDYAPAELTRFRAAKVEAMPVDDLVDKERLSHVNLISISTNGAEPEILRGLRRTLARDRPYICLARTADSYADLMDEIGYELVGDDDRGFTFRHRG